MDQRRRAGIYRFRRKLLLITLAFGASLLFFAMDAAWRTTPARAQEARPDSACRLCHVDSDGSVTLPSGEV